MATDATNSLLKTTYPLTTNQSLTHDEDHGFIDKTNAKFKLLPNYFYQRHHLSCLDHKYLLFSSLNQVYNVENLGNFYYHMVGSLQFFRKNHIL